jgi:ketosteroid isomerase-like protein
MKRTHLAERPMKTIRSRRAVIAAVMASIGLLGVVGVLGAHDFWIVPNAFAIVDGGTIEVLGQTSTRFPTSLSAVVPERVADARVIAAAGEERIADLSVSDKSLMLRHKPTTAGQRVIAVGLVTRTSRSTPANLKRYIALEGNTELAERYEREGAYGKADSLTQRTTKYAKTVVEVGRGGPRAFSRRAGHVLEFMPLNDPGSLQPGQSLLVQLLFRGRPVASAHLHAGSADTTQKDLSIVTDAEGRAQIPLERPGLWNVRTLHAAAMSGAVGEWEVAFATLVFQVGSGPAGSQGRPSDSSEVAAVVVRYHAAMASGDSAAALALLAPDAIVLESGGKETREEYRAHHLPADIGFARAVPSQRADVKVTVRGDVAWASSTSTSQGEFRGRQVNSRGAELMVLSREPDGWRIRAIHWSSRSRSP